MIYALTVDQLSGLPDLYRVTRKNRTEFRVRGLTALGRALKREAVKSTESPFIVRDQNGRALLYRPETGLFVYN